MDFIKESEMFNKAADYYDKYRPSYPRDIIDKLEEHTKIKAGSKLLEIGPGSGKATEMFTGKGYDILCIDPGEDLVNIGNSRFKGENIHFVKGRFEESALQGDFYDCIYAAQSFHWVPQPQGYEKCSYALKKDGYLALMRNMYITYDNDLDNELVAVSNQYGGFAYFVNEEECEKHIESIINGITSSGLFEEPKVYRKLWKQNYTAEDYYGFALTGNSFIQRSEEEKKKAYEDIKKLADKHGGIIERPYLTVLYIAKKM